MTYLVQCVTEGVEQTVYAGTLKRAFGTSRWLFVFDGLDEVPSDVKDEVSREVRNFIDDLLIDCASDALTICTSRPQGYSGQFDELDAASVELSALSPTQALECALPVLKIDRTGREAAEYYSTLKESIQSPAVQELMTTPLQAHIMAVVVRDGGRPPERKWQLFDNFYTVMRKREANRNLADRNLANLLRENSRVIKVLHNRLGFVLHSRAEKSSGARASLSRVELRDLVRAVVTQLQDKDIERTVKTLMEATTVRLVFVNTPEDSQEVRFDIRPLQEFFAAEFLYESVSAPDLVQRLALIAGDSHWREVIHFLFSALIENNRQTELTEAINVLEMKNGEIDNSAPRAVMRRLARGSAVAARLAQEGVLEEDKRIRHQFRRCLEPAFTATDDVMIDAISRISSRHTRSWLLDVVLDFIEEHSKSESIGAAVMLAMMLPDDHVRSAQVRNRLMASSSSYRGALFWLVETLPRRNYLRPPGRPSRWFLQTVLQSVIKPDWKDLTNEGVHSAFSILGMSGALVKRVATDCGLPRRIAEVCLPLFAARSDLSGRARPAGTERKGVFEFHYMERDPRLNFEKWDARTWRDLANTTGAIGLIYAVLNVARRQSLIDFYGLLGTISDDLSVLSYLPYHIQPYLPVHPWDPDWNIGTWRRMTAKELTSGYSRKYFGCNWSLRFDDPKTLDDWHTLIETSPHLAANMLSSTFRQYDGPDAAFDTILTGLVGKAIDEPRFLSEVPNSWGRLVTACSPDQRHILRAAIVQATANAPVATHAVGRIYPFALELPAESGLLPSIVCSLLSKIVQPRWPFGLYRQHEGLELDERDTIMRGFFPLATDLWQTAQQSGIPRANRAAATLLYLLHPQRDGANLEVAMNILPELNDLTESPW